MPLPPPPKSDDPRFDDWLFQLYKSLDSNSGLSITGPLVVTKNWPSAASTNLIGSFDNYGDAGRFTFRRADGSSGAPTQVLNGETIGQLSFRGYQSGGAFATLGSVSLSAIATENYTATGLGAQLSIASVATGASSAAVRLTIDGNGDVTATGFVKSSSPTKGIGYVTGAGGTISQATSKATAVTLNTACGAITMNAAALAASTTVSFVLNNSAIVATDVLVLNHISGGTVGSYSLNAQAVSGGAVINVRNISAGSLSEALVIQFAVLKAVNA